MNALAAGGVKLTSYYTDAICSPSRAALFTGRHSVALGMQHCAIATGSPWGLPLAGVQTLPQRVKAAGADAARPAGAGEYATSLFSAAAVARVAQFDARDRARRLF